MPNDNIPPPPRRAAAYPRDTAETVSTPRSRARRQFLKGIVGAAVAGAAVVYGWTAYLFPTRRGPAHALGPVAGFAPHAPPTLLPDADNAVYSVQNRGGGEFLVLSALCTHQGCNVGWDGAKDQFLCPCHEGRFDLSGKVVNGPPGRPLPALAHHVAGATLFVDG